MKNILLAITVFFLFSSHAFADDTICADRPGKTTATCTVPEGHLQIETDAYNGSFTEQDGVRTLSTLVFDPTIKYGLTKNIDIEATFAPYLHVRTGGHVDSGFGDTYFRLKYNFLKTDNFAVAVIPVVKAPTARMGLGNGIWEGGIQLPINYAINDKWSVASTPEIDFVKNAADNRIHLATQQTISISRSMPHGVTISGELWTSQNYDVKETRLYSVDVSAAWVRTVDMQLDIGVNFGLNRQAGTQIYFGISKKF